MDYELHLRINIKATSPLKKRIISQNRKYVGIFSLPLEL
jgi:hypothetical protein